jgi:hypothetical protein
MPPPELVCVPIEPTSVKLGYRSALATPMRSHCAMAANSLAWMSGRRRISSAGTLTAACAGVAGIPVVPASIPWTEPVGRPSSVLSAFMACCRSISSCGIDARVLSSSVVAWDTSSSEVAPLRKRDSAIRCPSSWSLTFAWACAISTSSVRITA